MRSTCGVINLNLVVLQESVLHRLVDLSEIYRGYKGCDLDDDTPYTVTTFRRLVSPVPLGKAIYIVYNWAMTLCWYKKRSFS